MLSTAAPSWDDALQAFQTIWGYSTFRPPQGEIVQGLLAGQDTLVIMPTGGGKSICFQLPALLQQGITLVVSPLVALMENQVQELKHQHLAADTLHGERPAYQRRHTLKALEAGRLRLLYVSPETLLSPPVWERLCLPHLRITGLVLDEAHCLVQWGDTFRPAYRRLGAVRPALLAHKPPGTKIAIAAFTATADPTVQRTLQTVLQLHQPHVVRLNPYRANLHLSVKVVLTPRGRKQALQHYIQSRSQQAGLVYVRTRRDSEELARWLHSQGLATAPYHAGLSPDQRRQVESDWLSDRIQFVVCTNAFGMGVNKPNTRWVIHFQAPSLLTEYVQEVGRAGRDGQAAEALTLVSEPTGWLDASDRQRTQFFASQATQLQQKAQQLARQIPPEGSVAEISQQFPEGAAALAYLHSLGQLVWVDPFHYRLNRGAGSVRQANKAQADPMHQYLHSRQCRWQQLLEQFGFRGDAQQLGQCGHCDNCQATGRGVRRHLIDAVRKT